MDFRNPEITDPYRKRIAADARHYDGEKLVVAESTKAIRYIERDMLAKGNLRDKGFRLTTSFYRSGAVNAYATIQGKDHAIGLSHRLLGEICTFSDRAFSHRSVFPKLGNSANEPRPRAARKMPQLEFVSSVTFDATRHRASHRNAERATAVAFLAVQMSLFVWLHELAHCVGGHVRLVRAHLPGARLNEMPERLDLVSLKSRLDGDAFRQIRHGLELEADRRAVTDLIRLQTRPQSHCTIGRQFDLETRLELAIFGAYLATWIFSASSDARTEDACLTHPTPLLRLRNITKALADNPRDLRTSEERARTALNELDFKPFPVAPFNPRLTVPDVFAPVPDGLAATRYD